MSSQNVLAEFFVSYLHTINYTHKSIHFNSAILKGNWTVTRTTAFLTYIAIRLDNVQFERLLPKIPQGRAFIISLLKNFEISIMIVFKGTYNELVGAEFWIWNDRNSSIFSLGESESTWVYLTIDFVQKDDLNMVLLLQPQHFPNCSFAIHISPEISSSKQ